MTNKTRILNFLKNGSRQKWKQSPFSTFFVFLFGLSGSLGYEAYLTVHVLKAEFIIPWIWIGVILGLAFLAIPVIGIGKKHQDDPEITLWDWMTELHSGFAMLALTLLWSRVLLVLSQDVFGSGAASMITIPIMILVLANGIIGWIFLYATIQNELARANGGRSRLIWVKWAALLLVLMIYWIYLFANFEVINFRMVLGTIINSFVIGFFSSMMGYLFRSTITLLVSSLKDR